MSVSGDEEENNEPFVSNDITEQEPTNICTYILPPIFSLYFLTVGLPQPLSFQRASLQPLAKSRRLSITSQFTTFLQYFVTNSPSDAARKLSKALQKCQKMTDYSNSHISDFEEYFAANHIPSESLAECENQPSKSTCTITDSESETASTQN